MNWMFILTFIACMATVFSCFLTWRELYKSNNVILTLDECSFEYARSFQCSEPYYRFFLQICNKGCTIYDPAIIIRCSSGIHYSIVLRRIEDDDHQKNVPAIKEWPRGMILRFVDMIPDTRNRIMGEDETTTVDAFSVYLKKNFSNERYTISLVCTSQKQQIYSKMVIGKNKRYYQFLEKLSQLRWKLSEKVYWLLTKKNVNDANQDFIDHLKFYKKYFEWIPLHNKVRTATEQFIKQLMIADSATTNSLRDTDD